MRFFTRHLFIFFLIAISGKLYSQNQFVQVSGYVYEAGTETPISFASLYNLRNKTGVVTSANGFFTILLNSSDSVRVHAMGYEDKRYGLPPNLQSGSYTINIYLRRHEEILDTVNVKPYDLDRLRDEFTNMPLVKEKEMVVGDPSVYSKYTPYRENFGVRLNGPLSWLYNKMSRKSKELDKLQDLRDGSNMELTGARRISRELIKETVPIQDAEIDDFVAHCRFANEDLSHASTYDIQMMIKECYKQYQAGKNNSTPPPVVKDTIH